MVSNNRYVRTNFTWIESPKYRSVMCGHKGIEMMFNIIRKYVIRDNTKSSLWRKVFKKYYCNNILASSITYTFIHEKTGLNKKTIVKYLGILEGAGFLKRDKIIGEDGNTYNVFILGKRKAWIKDDGMETYTDFWMVDDIVDDEIFNQKLSL